MRITCVIDNENYRFARTRSLVAPFRRHICDVHYLSRIQHLWRLSPRRP
jgi:hypothetical protein